MEKTHQEIVNSLAKRFNVEVEIVEAISDVLGDKEDLDGLPNVLEEYKELGFI